MQVIGAAWGIPLDLSLNFEYNSDWLFDDPLNVKKLPIFFIEGYLKIWATN